MRSCFLFLVLALLVVARRGAAQAQNCANPVACENQLPGIQDWQTHGDTTLEGFTTDISVNAGQTVNFKVSSPASSYVINIYRLGYYGGLGGRYITTITPSVPLPQTQPPCLKDSATNLIDCGNWAVSASWQVPSTAVSGLYLAQTYNPQTGGASHIPFIVRNDGSQSQIFFQTSDETWQAYNPFGGHSLYGGPATWDLANRAYKVSYNRPFETRSFEAATWLFNGEYPMIRWLEANGYDVSYTTGVDAVRNAAQITNHKVYLSVGHDEYWSGPQRTNIQAALAAGVNLAFFSGNEVFWKTRWESSIDGSNTPYRTLVCYKETLAGSILDPLDPPTWTGTWADPTFSPPADGGLPQNALTGTEFTVNGPGTDNTNLSIRVPAAYGPLRFWRNTSVANLSAGQTATLPAGTLGYEWDSDLDNGFRPPGLFDLSSATYNLTTDLLLDYGATFGAGTATHNLTMYRAPSGALVFGAGTVQWAWGLDSNHDGGSLAPDIRMQQATENLLADMGAQATTLQPGLVAASKSTDTAAPTSTITYPLTGSSIPFGSLVTVTGTAADTGGGVVAAVEVSVDAGKTWHRATGTASWSYGFTALTPGTVTIQSRAVDDSVNLETPSAGSTITVPGQLIASDATVTFGSSGGVASLSTPSFSTTQGNELLLVFVAADYLGGPSTTVTSVSGAGLTWTFVGRTNTQGGDSDIWRAFAPSQLSSVTVTATLSQTVNAAITLRSFTGIDTSGTNGSGAIGAVGSGHALHGAPTASLVTTRNGSLILGVGNDFDNATARTPGAGQTLISQDLSATGDTYWVQMLNQVVPQAGTAATLNDVAPTNDSYNLTIVEILPALGPSYNLSGSISPAAAGTGAAIALTGQSSGTTQSDGSGNYSFKNLQNGQYTITPTNPLYTFSPSNQTVTINGGNVTQINFTGTPVPTYNVSGTITGGAGAMVQLMATGENGTNLSTIADGSGNFSFSQVLNGDYTVTPSATGFLFTPANRAIIVNGASLTGVNFTASAVQTYVISGTISPSAVGSGTTVKLTGASTATVTADGSGNYSFGGLLNGNYTVTPTKANATFLPSSQPVTINSANVTANFTGTAQIPLAIDVTVSTDQKSKSVTVTSPVFSTKSPNELLLAFVSTDYLSGSNTSVTKVTTSGLTWVLVRRTNTQSGSAEIWRTFATGTLSGVSAAATLSQSVQSSITVVSFTGVDPSGTNGSGAIGATGTANAKTGAPSATLISTRNGSWLFGVGNDFDNATARTLGAGQTLIHQNLTSDADTYWVQRETATTPLSGTSVTINDTAPTGDRYNLTICEVLPAP